jgi:hypothetical protein
MSYTGGMAQMFERRHGRAVDDALRAGAEEYIEGLKEQKPAGLKGGYTSGAFSDDRQIDSLYVGDPFTNKGARAVFVFTDAKWAPAWEYGHINLFTGKYERQERWGPTLIRKQEDIFAAEARAYRRAFGA